MRASPRPKQESRLAEELRLEGEHTARQINRLVPLVATGARLLRNLVIGTAAAGTRVYHNLKRIPQGWHVVDRNANAVVWRLASDAETITLRASAAVTINLWIF